MDSLNVAKPFAQSQLWELQREYYENQGITAWSNTEVPHYITNNPAIAQAYAEVVFGFFRDRARLHSPTDEILYMLELGGGTGRLAYHFLTYLASLCEHATFEIPKYCYILSDISKGNIEFWKSHSRLQHFLEKGQLDFACFDAETDTEINLIHSGSIIVENSLTSPIVVIANYFFDTIPQDLFLFRQGSAYECNVQIHVSKERENETDAEWLEQLQLEYHYVALKSRHYAEEGYNHLLEAYRVQLDNSHVFFPQVGLRCLQRIRSLSHDGFLLVTADKGHHRLKQLDGERVPMLIRHGSGFSINVNYHALSAFFQNEMACSYFTTHGHQHLNVGCIVMCQDASSYKETELAYSRHVESYGPDDFFSIRRNLEEHLANMTMKDLMSYFRFSKYDAQLFKLSTSTLLNKLPQCTMSEKEDLFKIIYKVWNGYYPIGEPQDLAFDQGLLLFQMKFYEDAIVFFERSLEEYGEAAPLYYNMALCYNMLRNHVKTLEYLDYCLLLDPAHSEAQSFKLEIHTYTGGEL